MGHTGNKFKEKETAVKFDEFKGSRIFGIWEVDEEGNNVSERPLVSFGKGKAKAIVKHIEELQEFIDE